MAVLAPAGMSGVADDQRRRQHREQHERLLAAQLVGDVAAADVAHERAGDEEEQVAAGADDGEAAGGLEVGRQPGEQPVVAALHAGGQQRREHRRAQQRAAEDREERAAVGALLAPRLGLGRVLDRPPHVEHEQRGECAGPEQHPPAELRADEAEHDRVDDHAEPPADGPRALHPRRAPGPGARGGSTRRRGPRPPPTRRRSRDPAGRGTPAASRSWSRSRTPR